MVTNKLIVQGIVQGVGFRYMTKRVADQLHVVGTVQNLSDGSVKIIAQTDSETMKQFLAKIKESPSPSGYVKAVTTTELIGVEPMHSFRVTG